MREQFNGASGGEREAMDLVDAAWATGGAS